jgi:trimeric autotransporter adhesin
MSKSPSFVSSYRSNHSKSYVKVPSHDIWDGTYHPKPTGGNSLDRLIERKQMSTKTTFKRVALATVAAMGFGLLSVVPASAAPADVVVTATLTTGTQTAPVGSTVTTTIKATGAAEFATSKDATLTLAAATAPASATGTSLASAALSLTDSTLTNTSNNGYIGTLTSTTVITVAGGSGTPNGLNPETPVVGTVSVTAKVPGTYTYTITPEGGTGTDVAATFTIHFVETSVSISTIAATAFSVGANGKGGSYLVRYAGSTTATDSVVNPKARALSAPALSGIAAGLLIGDTTVANGQADFAAGNTATNDVNATASANSVTGKTYYDATFAFWPDKDGAYSFLFFNDTNDNGFVDGSDVSTTLTITVGSSVAAITTTAMSTTGAVSGADGVAVVLSVKDANGTVIAPSAAEGVLVSLTGAAKVAKVNGTSVTAASTYTLGTNDFDAKGQAYLNITNGTAESVILTANGSGSTASSVAATALGLTFSTASDTGGLLAPVAAAKVNVISVNSYEVKVGAVTAAFEVAGTTDTVYKVTVTDTTGRISGKANLKWDRAVTGAASKLSVSQAATTIAVNDAYTLTTNGGAVVVTAKATDMADADSSVTASPSAISAVAGATTAIKAIVKDQFGNALPNAIVTITYSGRNTQLGTSVLVTDSLGSVTFTYTDTAVGVVGSTDTITFSAVSVAGGTAKTTNVTVSYNALNAISSVLINGGNTTDSVTATTVIRKDILAGTAGASTSVNDVTATVKNAAGAALAGVAVTFTVTGTGAAVPSNEVTVYTNTSGVATSAVYGWIAGTYTYTATAGAVSGSGTITFAQTAAGEERAISATVSGSIVTAKVVDRFGNPVPLVKVWATKSGIGYFGNGLTKTDGTTDTKGEVQFTVAGGNADVTVATYDISDVTAKGSGQTCSRAGTATCADLAADDTALTATTVGTAITAETGVGASLSAAGVAKATVSVVADTANLDAATAAADAAAEATDAANAATDAANAAAEAADAATAAAQDAADAVAALSTQVSEMVNALKKQITALTNLVIKIQKKVKA